MPAPNRPPSRPASLLLLHARIPSIARPFAGADAVAIGGGHILAVGPASELRPLLGRNGVCIDCGGHMLSPGFIDAHIHLLGTAARLRYVDCSDAVSVGEIVERIRARATSASEEGWIRAFGYHEQTLKERRHPLRHDLDRATGDRPVRLTHRSGHASVLNGAAFSRLGIDAATAEPPGGTIDRDPETGDPSGLLLEMEDWLDRRMPHSQGGIEESLAALSRRLLAAGVTSVQDLGHRNDRLRAEYLARMVGAGVFRPRLTLATGYEAFEVGEDAVAEGIGAGPIKLMLNETGERVLPEAQELARRIAFVHRRGRQAAIHAIGRDAVAAAVTAIERAQKADGRRGRHRIEHASIVTPDLAARMAAAGIIAVSNPGFLRQHGDRYLESVPTKQLPLLYDVAGLSRGGVEVAAGSDCPAGPLEPATGIAAATTRRTASGRQLPGRTLPLNEAVRIYTTGAAGAAFEEGVKGALAPGFLADLVLLEELEGALRPRMTILAGEIVWSADDGAATTPSCPERVAAHAR